MASLPKDLQGWQVITTDEQGNITTNSRRRSRKNNSVEKIYIQRIADGLSFSSGDSVVMHDAVTGVFSVYLIHEIRQNTLNNLIEIWAFSYLRSFELKAEKYYSQFNPKMLEKSLSEDQLKDTLFNELDPYELYLTAELSEIWLKDFKYVAQVYTKEEYDKSPRDRSEVDPVDFYVRFICEPTAERFVKMNINKEVEKIKSEEPKVSDERLKKMTVNIKRTFNNRASSFKKKVGHQLKESRVEPDFENDETASSRAPISNTTSSRPYESAHSPNQQKKSPSFYAESESESHVNTPISVTSNSSSDHNIALSSTDSDIDNQLSDKDKDKYNTDEEEDEDDKLQPSNLKRRALRKELFGSGRKERKVKRLKESQSTNASSDEDTPLSQIKSVAVKSVPESFGSENAMHPVIEQTLNKTSATTQPSEQSSKEFMLLKSKYMKLKLEFKADNSNDIITSILPRDADRKDSYKQLDIAALESQIRSNASNGKKIRTIFSKLKTQKGIDDDKSIIQVIQDFIELPARSKEFARCYLEIFDSLRKNESKAIYINGRSGSGKTCIVKKLLTEVEKSSNYKEVSLFIKVILNRKTQGEDFYKYLWESLSGDDDVVTSSNAAERSLEYFFTSVDKNRKRHTVIILDDLDILCNECPNLLYNFFHWTTYPNSKLIVIAMGQNPDLIKETLGRQVLSRINYYNIPFENYSSEEIMNIVNYRLKNLKSFYNFKVYQVKDTHSLVVEKVQEGDKQVGDDIGSKIVKVYMDEQRIDEACKKICLTNSDAEAALRVIDDASNDAMKKYAAVQTIIMKRNKSFIIANLPASQEIDLNTISKSLNKKSEMVNVDMIYKLPYIEKLFLFSCLTLVRNKKTLILETKDIHQKMADLINNNKTKRFFKSVLKILMADNDTVIGREKLQMNVFEMLNWNMIIKSMVTSQFLEIIDQDNNIINSIKMKIPLLDLSDGLNLYLID